MRHDDARTLPAVARVDRERDPLANTGMWGERVGASMPVRARDDRLLGDGPQVQALAGPGPVPQAGPLVCQRARLQ